MKYKLLKKQFGVSSITKIAELEISHPIKDISYMNDIGIVFLYEDYLGCVNFEGVIDYKYKETNLKNPISVYYSNLNEACYVFGDGGRNLRYYQKRLENWNNFFGTVYSRKWIELINNIPNDFDLKLDMALDRFGDLYVTNNFYNRVYQFTGSEFYLFAGDKKSGYSLSNNLEGVRFNNLSSISYYNGAFYLTDTDNSCIRRVHNKKISDFFINKDYKDDSNLVEYSLGHPVNLRIKNEIGYFIDDDKIKCVSVTDKNIDKVYDSNDIVSIDIDEEKNLFVLERG